MIMNGRKFGVKKNKTNRTEGNRGFLFFGVGMADTIDFVSLTDNVQRGLTNIRREYAPWQDDNLQTLLSQFRNSFSAFAARYSSLELETALEFVLTGIHHPHVLQEFPWKELQLQLFRVLWLFCLDRIAVDSASMQDYLVSLIHTMDETGKYDAEVLEDVWSFEEESTELQDDSSSSHNKSEPEPENAV